MNISSRDFSKEYFHEQYIAISDLANAIEKNSLTIEDLVVISRMLVGCTKLAAEASNRALRNKKRVTRKLRASILLQYKLAASNKEKFRPSEIKKSFPDDLIGFDQADLTNLLSSYTRANWLVKTSSPIAAPGKPRKCDPDVERGVKSFYEKSDYYGAVMEIISKPEKLRIVCKLLLESRVIHIYLPAVFLYSFVSISLRGFVGNRGLYDIVAKKLGTLLNPDVEKKIQEYQNQILSLDKEKLELLAGTMAENWLRKSKFHCDPIIIDFCLQGGLNYQA